MQNGALPGLGSGFYASLRDPCPERMINVYKRGILNGIDIS